MVSRAVLMLEKDRILEMHTHAVLGSYIFHDQNLGSSLPRQLLHPRLKENLKGDVQLDSYSLIAISFDLSRTLCMWQFSAL